MRRAMLTAVAALVAACVGPNAIYFGDEFSTIYDRLEVQVAGRQGPVPLLIRGNPFAGVDAPRLAGATVGAMSTAGLLAPIRLTTGDPGPRSVDYRIIVAFGEPPYGANGLCASPDAAFEVPARIAATAAFCIGDRLLSTTRGRLFETVRAPEDPAFADFLRGLTNMLLPLSNPRMRRCADANDC